VLIILIFHELIWYYLEVRSPAFSGAPFLLKNADKGSNRSREDDNIHKINLKYLIFTKTAGISDFSRTN